MNNAAPAPRPPTLEERYESFLATWGAPRTAFQRHLDRLLLVVREEAKAEGRREALAEVVAEMERQP